MTNGQISISPDPPDRGTTITVTLTGGIQGFPGTQVACHAYDNAEGTMDFDVIIDENGRGTATATIPQTWGLTLTIEAAGFDDFSTGVGGPSPMHNDIPTT
jgi:hypothetical protein